MPPDTERPLKLGYWLSSDEHDPRVLVANAVRAEDAGFSHAAVLVVDAPAPGVDWP